MLNRLSAPLTVFLEVTSGCNLRCVYCSADAGAPNTHDLSPEELYRLISEIIEIKVFKMIITGGEPFVRTDIFEILERLVDARITVSINSNGTMISDRVAERLVALGLTSLNISLDGSTAEVNDLTRGEGAFERTLTGVRTLIRHGIRPAILATLTRTNYDRIIETVEGLREYDVQSVSFNLMSQIGRGGSCSTLTLGREDLAEVRDRLRTAQDKYDRFVKEGFLYWYSYPQRLEKRSSATEDRRPTMLPCDAGKAACAIAADGTVFPCNKFAGYSCGNVREQSLRDIWRGERMERIRRLGQTPTENASGCSRCRYNVICAGGCRAEAYVAYQDLEAPDPTCLVLADSSGHAYESPADLVRIACSA